MSRVIKKNVNHERAMRACICTALTDYILPADKAQIFNPNPECDYCHGGGVAFYEIVTETTVTIFSGDNQPCVEPKDSRNTPTT